MDIPPAEVSNGGSGTAGGGYLHLPPLEHGRTFHCNQAQYGPVYDRGSNTRAKDIQEVVRTGRGGCGRDAYGGLGGVTN